MPALAVRNAFFKRSIVVDGCTPEQVYTIAWSLGVGYTTLITHMYSALNMIAREQATKLKKHQPKDIRAKLLGMPVDNDVIPVGFEWWPHHPVDAQVGDLILLPPDVSISEAGVGEYAERNSTRTLVTARRPGVTVLQSDNTGWAVHLRVARRQYAGLARYRFLEEEEGETDGNDRAEGFLSLSN